MASWRIVAESSRAKGVNRKPKKIESLDIARHKASHRWRYHQLASESAIIEHDNRYGISNDGIRRKFREKAGENMAWHQ